ncbi:MAG: Kelch repeat-containing protein [Candidatus Woesearchaeota archaeon]
MRKKKLILFISVLLTIYLLQGCTTHQKLKSIEGEWYQNQAMPYALAEFASTIHNETIYFGGGFEPEGITSSLFIKYNPHNNNFTQLQNIPIGLHHTSIAYLNGKIYLAGGWENLSYEATNYFYKYNTKNNTWTKKEEMPYARAAHRVIPYNNSIYVIGGVGESPETILKYTINENRWKEVIDLPVKKEHHTVEIYNKKIYIVSGRWNGRNIASVTVLNLETKEFSSIPIPKGVSGHASTIIGNKLHIIGGENLQTIKSYNTHQILNLETEQLYHGAPLPTKRHGHHSHTYNNSIIVLGGAIDAEYNTFKTTTAMIHTWKNNK